eukprot:g15981.t1
MINKGGGSELRQLFYPGLVLKASPYSYVVGPPVKGVGREGMIIKLQLGWQDKVPRLVRRHAVSRVENSSPIPMAVRHVAEFAIASASCVDRATVCCRLELHAIGSVGRVRIGDVRLCLRSGPWKRFEQSRSMPSSVLTNCSPQNVLTGPKSLTLNDLVSMSSVRNSR